MPRRGIDAVPVSYLHNTQSLTLAYDNLRDYRRGRHVISALHVHLVFVTKYRRGVLDADMLRCCQEAIRKVCGEFGAEMAEFNG